MAASSELRRRARSSTHPLMPPAVPLPFPEDEGHWQANQQELYGHFLRRFEKERGEQARNRYAVTWRWQHFVTFSTPPKTIPRIQENVAPHFYYVTLLK